MILRPLLRPLLRPVVLTPALAILLGVGARNPIRRIFASGVDGYWRDPSDLTTSYQDSAGTTAGAVDSAVGLMLDKSDRLAIGSELVTNGDFASSGTGWTSSAGVVFAVGSATFPNAASGTEFFFRALVLSATKTYIVVVSGTGTVSVRLDTGTSYSVTLPGTLRLPSASNPRVQIFNVAGSAAVVTSVSVKELAGNHTTQSTGGSRPLLKLVSGYYGDQFDGLDDYVVSTSGGGGSAGFFYCGAVYVGGGAGTVRNLWSDRGTNIGYIVRLNTLDQFSLLAGNGAAFTAVATTGTMPVGEMHVVTAFDDGTNLSVQIDSGTAATVARPAVSAGAAGFSEGKDHAAASGYHSGRLGTRVYFKGYCPDAATREQIKRYIAIRSGVAL